MRIRELFNQYLRKSYLEVGLEGATEIFFNPLFQEKEDYTIDSAEQALREDEQIVREGMKQATDRYAREH
jgi:hypothetical protein